MVEGITTASTALRTQQVQANVAARVLKQANTQQQSAVSLLDSAAELVNSILKDTLGHLVDTRT